MKSIEKSRHAQTSRMNFLRSSLKTKPKRLVVPQRILFEIKGIRQGREPDFLSAGFLAISVET